MRLISKQLICISIIILLVSVSYTSAIRVSDKIPIVNNQGEDDCGCNEFSDYDIVKLEKNLNKLESSSKKSLELSKDFPILNKKIEKLSYKISNIKEEFENEPPNPILCIIYIGMYLDIYIILTIITPIIKLSPFMTDEKWQNFSSIVMAVIFETLVLIIYHCNIGPYVPTPFNLNNILTERNNLLLEISPIHHIFLLFSLHHKEILMCALR